MSSDRYKQRIEQLETEIKESQEELEITSNQSTIAKSGSGDTVHVSFSRQNQKPNLQGL